MSHSSSHRQWPAPDRPSVWRQRWHDLLFMHWRVDASVLRRRIPSSLEIDCHEGEAWLGLVPFRMTGITFRGLPPVPWLSAFAEMNVRTYVTRDGRPGVWFFRMDAARLPAVIAARRTLGLPYHWSRMRVAARGDAIEYTSERDDARFRACYEPIGPATESRPGSLESFLTDRFCLYSVKAGRLIRVEIDHPPWPLQIAKADVSVNTIAQTCDLPAAGPDVLLHFSRQLEVVGWNAEDISRA